MGTWKLICVPMGTYDVEAVCWGSGICKFDQRPFFCGNLGHLNSLHPPVCHPCRLPSSQNGIFHFSNAVILTHTHTQTKECACCSDFSPAKSSMSPKPILDLLSLQEHQRKFSLSRSPWNGQWTLSIGHLSFNGLVSTFSKGQKIGGII